MRTVAQIAVVIALLASSLVQASNIRQGGAELVATGSQLTAYWRLMAQMWEEEARKQELLAKTYERSGEDEQDSDRKAWLKKTAISIGTVASASRALANAAKKAAEEATENPEVGVQGGPPPRPTGTSPSTRQ